MLRIAVVDDDLHFQEQICDYIRRYFQQESGTHQIRCYQDGVTFLSEYQSDYDIVIIDIMMPRMNGIEVAHKLRTRDKNVLIVFITITPAFAIRGYEVSAMDYILKPLSYEVDFKYKFDRVVKKANALKSHSRELILKDENGRFVRLNVEEVTHVVKERDNVVYHTKQGVFSQRTSIYKVRDSLQDLETFAVVNSGSLVNMAFVHNIKDNVVELNNGELLVLSRSKKKEFYEKFFAYMDH